MPEWHAFPSGKISTQTIFNTLCLGDGWELCDGSTVGIPWYQVVSIWPSEYVKRMGDFHPHLRSPFHPVCSVRDLVWIAWAKAFDRWQDESAGKGWKRWDIAWQVELPVLLALSASELESELLLQALLLPA